MKNVWLEMSKFKRGVLVRLKSGGPAMLVEMAIGNRVFCCWQRGANQISRSVFYDYMLVELIQVPI